MTIIFWLIRTPNKANKFGRSAGVRLNEVLLYIINQGGFCPSKTGFGRDSGPNLVKTGLNWTKLNDFIKSWNICVNSKTEHQNCPIVQVDLQYPTQIGLGNIVGFLGLPVLDYRGSIVIAKPG